MIEDGQLLVCHKKEATRKRREEDDACIHSFLFELLLTSSQGT